MDAGDGVSRSEREDIGSLTEQKSGRVMEHGGGGEIAHRLAVGGPCEEKTRKGGDSP